MADLETPDPTPQPETPPPVESTPPPQAATPPEPDDDAVDIHGVKHVPIAAVLAEREKAKSYKEKADAYDQVAQQWNQVQPYIQFLKENPTFMSRTAEQTQPTPTTTTQPVDPEAEELARTLDLYTADGKPDAARAVKITKIVDRIAEQKAEAKVKPLAESTTRERAQHNYQRALATKAPDGRTPDRNVLDALWSRTDPSITATEEGATAVVMLALGMGAFQGQQAPPQAPPQAPVTTEAPGPRNLNRPGLTALDEKIAGLRGRSTDDWAKLTRTFNPGRPSVLED